MSRCGSVSPDALPGTVRTVQVVPEFVETGAFYAMRTAGFREARHRFFGKTILFETHPSTHFELDEKSDVAIAEERFRSAKREAAQSMLPVSFFLVSAGKTLRHRNTAAMPIGTLT